MDFKKYKIIIIGISLGIGFWWMEALLHFLIFRIEKDFITSLLFPEPHETWMRIFIVFLFLTFSIYSQYFINLLNKGKNELEESHNQAEFFESLFTHDINNILQNIKTSLNLISLWKNDVEKKEKIDKIIEIINDQTIRGSNLILNIRKLGQIDQFSQALTPIEVTQTLNKAIEFVKQTYAYKEIYIQLNSTINEFYIRANEFLMDIFENILFNAVKHNENPKIEIIIQLSTKNIEGNSFLKLEFIDNGVGIPNEMKKKIFEGVIYRERKIKGMGLGLLLTSKILNIFGGKIQIEDRVKGDYTQGSNFIIYLPSC